MINISYVYNIFYNNILILNNFKLHVHIYFFQIKFPISQISNYLRPNYKIFYILGLI